MRILQTADGNVNKESRILKVRIRLLFVAVHVMK